MSATHFSSSELQQIALVAENEVEQRALQQAADTEAALVTFNEWASTSRVLAGHRIIDKLKELGFIR